MIKMLKYSIVFVLIAVGCKNKIEPEVKTIETLSEDKEALDLNANYAKAEFTIEGMTCAIGCARTIEKKLAKMAGVKSASVDFDTKTAKVEFDDSKVTPVSLEETVTKVADLYKVHNMKTVDVFSSK